LLQFVLDAALGSCVRQVVLVLGYHAGEIHAALRLPAGERVHVVTNPDCELGQSTSLRRGLAAADPRAEAAAILLGDQPAVTSDLIDRIANAFVCSRAAVARPVFRASAGERIPGHPVFLARRVWREVAELHGDRGARDLIAAHPEWLVEVPIEGDPPIDIDTWDDYRMTVDT